ncbi:MULTISPECIES: restriction endonuclease subunit S [unclassified Acinetobacter]|uniref:restriction endonuclease subunit S n=1 Tax=unclassified Acinetobacter TaxID=196816 RepID=UPI0015D240A7|nr:MULTISPECIES: restriction endonuclease subunit S [unclassified Acinetobacter]
MPTPKLRFKEFDGDWTKVGLDKISKVFDGTHQTPNYVESGIKFVSVENIHAPYESDKFITEEAFNKDFKNKPEPNDILMTRITAGEIGATAIVDDREPLAYYVSLALIRPTAKVTTPFLNQYIGTPFFKNELHKRIIHVAFPKKINLGDINECLVSCPEKQEEQTKIASFLSAVDEKISQLMQKYQLLSQYKQGMMQKLFSQQLRFKADDGSEFGEWEEKKLGEISKTFSGGTPQSSNKSFYEGTIPFIKSGEISKNTTEQCINDLALEKSSAKLVKKGDLLYALYGATSGQVAISQIDGAINQAVLCIRSELNTKYLLNFLLLKKEEILTTYLQGGQGNLSASILKEIYIPTPCLEEQTKIANFLSAIDQKIEVVAEQIEQAKIWKKGLLQQMFV